MVKSYNLPIDYVLYDMSYANMMLYNAVLPSYDFDKDKDKEQKHYDMTKPENKNVILDLIKHKI